MRTLTWLCAGLLLAAGASAQTRYSCRMPDGRPYISDRPCVGASVSPGTGAGSSSQGQGMVYYGPSQTTPSYPTYIPRTSEAPGWLRYMSPRCSSLYDGIRTASIRGLTSETQSGMRREYQQNCQEDESEARQRFSREAGEERRQKIDDKRAQAQAVERTKLQEQQCGESKRILHVKKQRTDLSEGERADLQRFEEAYKARCS